MRHKIVTVAEMIAIEKHANDHGHHYATMMQQAGAAAADFTVYKANELSLQLNVCVLVGPGNNGGDGLVLAKQLMTEHDADSVSAYLLKPRADTVLQDAIEAGVYIIDGTDDSDLTLLRAEVDSCDILVDALLGTGIQLPLRDNVQAVLRATVTTIKARNSSSERFGLLTTVAEKPEQKPYIIAIDCPSGLDCDTGAVDEHTLKVNATITFAAAKYGHFTFPGAAYVGELAVGSIGLSDTSIIHNIRTEVATAHGRLRDRKLGSHKGTYGKALIAAGSANYIGAAYLSAAGAYRSGAGLVTVATSAAIIHPLATQLPEATWLHMSPNANQVELLQTTLQQNYSAFLMGPGWGQHTQTKQLLLGILETHVEQPLPSLVLDADALNILATTANWHTYLPANTIITPHPGEFGRLTGLSTSEVQANRVAAARYYAAEWQCIVVLKGAHTVIAAPNGHTWISPIATDALAVAGTGDVLAGMIVGLLAQGSSPADAAVAAVWLHGRAGMIAGWDVTAPVMASDVLESIWYAFEELGIKNDA